ncbi:unnamed protein product [Nippostrongylus brasiliensis]|uniref:FBD domain-containing protein n=1 Tax=Nippostrongylus brasiliensis TaxID=27835 RepID=A0A0N4Y219_NIPBR|nr:unnamed protein product [Nippostrongylus brasiliensis]
MVSGDEEEVFIPSGPIVVWMQRTDSYVENIRNLVLRVKHPSKFGENVQVIELTDSRNPLAQLSRVLRNVAENELVEFLSRVKLLLLDTTDVDIDDLLFIMRKMHLLAAFSFSDVRLTKKDWDLVLPELKRLNLRALDISREIPDHVFDKLNVELLKFSGSPGVKASVLKECRTTFITVQTLIAQDLDYTDEKDAEILIACIESKFPRLKTLVWDWSIVDPAVTVDKRSKEIIAKLLELFRKMELECFAIVAYTPCNDTKFASGELARFLSEAGLPSVQLLRFASKGLSEGQDNFTVITAGANCHSTSKIHSIYVEGRTSAPDLRYLMQLLDDATPPFSTATVVEFGGFNGEEVRRAFQDKKPRDTLEI